MKAVQNVLIYVFALLGLAFDWLNWNTYHMFNFGLFTSVSISTIVIVFWTVVLIAKRLSKHGKR